MMKPAELSVTMLKMLAVIREFGPAVQVRTLTHQALLAQDGLDYEARLHEQPFARVRLEGEEITFETHDGVCGRLFPDFALDPHSLTTTAQGRCVDVASVLDGLKNAFRLADDVRVVATGAATLGEDDETFIVDPQISDTLVFEHQT